MSGITGGGLGRGTPAVLTVPASTDHDTITGRKVRNRPRHRDRIDATEGAQAIVY